jgi:UrcA family protein
MVTFARNLQDSVETKQHEAKAMNPRYSILRATCVMIFGLGTGAISYAGPADESTSTVEVLVQSTPIVKTTVQTGVEEHGEIAVVAMKVRYNDLSLGTYSGQAMLRNRVLDAAKYACARVGTAFAPGARISSTSSCVATALEDARFQIEAVIAEARKATGTL